MVVDRERAESRFAYALVQTDRFLAAAETWYGTHMPSAGWGIISGVEYHLPSLPEQRAIAAVLSDVGELIESLQSLIHKKRAIKQAARQELPTGTTKLPGFGGEWEMRRLGHHITFLRHQPSV